MKYATDKDLALLWSQVGVISQRLSYESQQRISALSADLNTAISRINELGSATMDLLERADRSEETLSSIEGDGRILTYRRGPSIKLGLPPYRWDARVVGPTTLLISEGRMTTSSGTAEWPETAISFAAKSDGLYWIKMTYSSGSITHSIEGPDTYPTVTGDAAVVCEVRVQNSILCSPVTQVRYSDIVTGSSGLDHPFKVSIDSDHVVRVHKGKWTRNGLDPITLTLATPNDYALVSSLDAASATYYIYVALESATYDERLRPGSLIAYASAANVDPAELYGDDLIRVVAEVSTDGSGNCVTVYQVQYSNIDDTLVVPDAESTYDSGSDHRWNSMEWRTTGNRHYGNLQDYDWGNLTDQECFEYDLFTFKRFDGSGASATIDKKYCTPQSIIKAVDWTGDTGNLDDGITGLGYIKECDPPAPDHYNVGSTNVGTPDAHDFADSGGENNSQHDKRYPPAWVGTGQNYDLKNYRTTGIWHMSEIHINNNWGGTDVQQWTGTAFTASFSGSGNVITLTSSAGQISMTTGQPSTWELAGLTLQPHTAGSDILTIGTWHGIGITSNDYVRITAGASSYFRPSTTNCDLNIGGTGTDKAWNAIGVYAASSINISSGSDSYWGPSSDNSMDLTFGVPGGSVLKWRIMTFYAGGATNIYSGDDSKWVPSTSGKDLNIGETGASSTWEDISFWVNGNVLINNTAGATVANWVTKGFVTGSLIEVPAGEYDPGTDYILVRRV